MEYQDLRFPKVREKIKGVVVDVKSDRILIDLNSYTEGVLYLEGYSKPAPKSFLPIIKVGDIIEAQVTKASDGERNQSSEILLSRLPILRDLSLQKLETAYANKEEITTKVVSSLDKGLVLSYEGNELFLPVSLLDRELIDKKDALVKKDLVVVIEEIRKQPRLRVVATRRPIFEKTRQEAISARKLAKDTELASFSTGQVIEGTVEKLENYGALIKFEHNVGMLRLSQVSHHRIDKITDMLKLGQKISVKIIKIEGNKIDLSLKALIKTPFEVYSENHKVGQKVVGKVVQKVPFGIFIELDKDVQGLLHKNEISWNPQDNTYDYIHIGAEIELVILNKNVKDKKISLSKKVLEDNPWASADVKVGQYYDVLVTEITKDGLKVACQSIDGFIKNSEASSDKIKLEDYFTVGDTITAKAIKFNREDWIFDLSVKQYQKDQERKDFEDYLKENREDKPITIGDIVDLDIKKK